jgi:hypothetical protein
MGPYFNLRKAASGAYDAASIAQKRVIGKSHKFAQSELASETGIIVAIHLFYLATSLPASKISLSNDSH